MFCAIHLKTPVFRELLVVHIAQESDKKIVIYAQGSRGRRAMTAAAPPIYKIILKN